MLTKMKNTRPKTKYSGLTLVELMVASCISVIVILAVATLLADSQKGFNRLYENTNSDVAQDENVIRKIFASVIRQSSTSDTATSIGTDGQWLQVQYYSSTNADSLDRYAKFYLQNDQLILEKGSIDPLETISLQTVAHNVQSVHFNKIGTSIQMYLDLNDQTYSREVITSANLKNP